MLAIELKFPTGKLHATPWGRHVNEGAVEWPPSPWRILRALIAVWHHKFPSVSEAEMRALIDALATAPHYNLPQVSDGHTRHYMPTYDSKTKIFDTFIAISPQDGVIVSWPDIELSDEQSQLLAKLLEAMSYFGRAESWTIARVLPDYDGKPNTSPLNGHGVQAGEELVRVLSPTSAEEHASWRKKMLEDLMQQAHDEKLLKEAKKAAAGKKHTPPEKVKLTPGEIEKEAQKLPETIFDALHLETDELRKAGWNRPPASEWTDYVRPRQNLRITKSYSPPMQETLPTVARFAVAGAVRPLLTEAILIGDRVRKSLLKISDAAPVFLGKDVDSNAITPSQGHQHAHYLCESNNDRQGRITHVTVYAPQGFDLLAEKWLNQFNKTWGNDGHDLQYVLLGIGQPQDFGGIDEKKGQSPILATSQVWVSRTPFLPTHHFHIRGYDNSFPAARNEAIKRELTKNVRKELESRARFPFAENEVQIEWLPAKNWLKFKRHRYSGGGTQGNSSGFGLRLTFSKPVQGPIILGYGCHYGLGLFSPEGSQK